MNSMMDESKQLRDAVRWQRRSKPGRASKLGEAIRELMEDWISPQQARFGSIVQVWNRLLPTELRRHCKIADIFAGQLKVVVDSPLYLYELRLCSCQLLGQLQQQCPGAGIKKIKFVVG